MSSSEKTVNSRAKYRRIAGLGVMPEVYHYPGIRRRRTQDIRAEWIAAAIAIGLAIGVAGISAMDTVAERWAVSNHQARSQAVDLNVLATPPSYNPRPTSVAGGLRLPAMGSGPQG